MEKNTPVKRYVSRQKRNKNEQLKKVNESRVEFEKFK